jgi:hypothetical protein
MGDIHFLIHYNTALIFADQKANDRRLSSIETIDIFLYSTRPFSELGIDVTEYLVSISAHYR